MNNQLQDLLRQQINSDWQSNPAMRQIIDGYAQFHAVLAITGSLFLLTILTLSIFSWTRFKKAARIDHARWSFKKKMHFYFGVLFTLNALFLVLIVTANITNAVDPLRGFSGSISSISTSSNNIQLNQSFSEWIVSKDEIAPSLVKQRIHERQMFHVTRAAISITLLVGLTTLSVTTWRLLARKRSDSQAGWNRKERILLLATITTIMLSLLMMVVVMANIQGAVAPIANTLQFG